jgi:hypothetical protein
MFSFATSKKKICLKSNFNDKQIQILEVAETLFRKGFDEIN